MSDEVREAVNENQKLAKLKKNRSRNQLQK